MNETPAACQDRTTEPLLRIEAVSRQFDGGSVQALRNVSLTIGRGEYLAIMGPSGSGKSTLLNLIGALDRPDRGEITFEGQSLAHTTDLAHFRAKTLGFIFQSFHLIPTLTALENVQIPMFAGLLPARRRASKAEALLALVGMSHRAGHLPPKLSVGERQRVAIARSLGQRSPAAVGRRTDRESRFRGGGRRARPVRQTAPAARRDARRHYPCPGSGSPGPADRLDSRRPTAHDPARRVIDNEHACLGLEESAETARPIGADDRRPVGGRSRRGFPGGFVPIAGIVVSGPVHAAGRRPGRAAPRRHRATGQGPAA